MESHKKSSSHLFTKNLGILKVESPTTSFIKQRNNIIFPLNYVYVDACTLLYIMCIIR